MIIAIDFDGTCVTHEFPNIGLDIGAVPVLQRLVKEGHKLILWTMRSNIVNPTSTDATIVPIGGNYLDDAVQWFRDNGIYLWGINCNPEQKTWTLSPKVYAQLYIDDAGLNFPLTQVPCISDRSYADWVRIEAILTEKGILCCKK